MMSNKYKSVILVLLIAVAVIPGICHIHNFKLSKSTIKESVLNEAVEDGSLSDITGISDPQKVIVYVPFQYFITSNSRQSVESDNDNYYNLIYGRKLDFGSIPHKILEDKVDIDKLMASLDSMAYIGMDKSDDCGLAFRIGALPKRTSLGIEKTIPDFHALVLIFPDGNSSPAVVCHTGDMMIYNGYHFRVPNFYQNEDCGYYLEIFHELVKEGRSNIII